MHKTHYINYFINKITRSMKKNNINVYKNPEFANTLKQTKKTNNCFSIWADPLPNVNWRIPIGKHQPGSFGYISRNNNNINTGVDLICAPGTDVAAVESGTVVNIEYFTGPEASCPEYNTSMAILIASNNSVILYGYIEPLPEIKPGILINSGQLIGKVVSLQKNEKNIKKKNNKKSMLRIELYKKNTIKSIWWEYGKTQPKRLLDPTKKLLAIKTQKF